MLAATYTQYHAETATSKIEKHQKLGKLANAVGDA
jgi:hypothetical protein